MKTWPEVWGIECIDVDIKAGVWHRTHCVTSLLQKSFTSENSLRFISLALDIITSVLTAASLTLSLSDGVYSLLLRPALKCFLFLSSLSFVLGAKKNIDPNVGLRIEKCVVYSTNTESSPELFWCCCFDVWCLDVGTKLSGHWILKCFTNFPRSFLISLFPDNENGEKCLN